MILSIVIAAYNVELFIAKCIESCYSEQYKNECEIIVVNDGSTDGTAAICEELLLKFSNLKIIYQDNQGLGAARNKGISKSTGDYIWMIDGDDVLTENVFSILFNELRFRSDVYSFNYNVTNELGKVLSRKYPENHIRAILTGSEYYAEHSYNSYTWQFVFKREIFLKHNIRFKERINMQDSEILPKIMLHANSVKYIDYVAYNYVQQAGSFTNSSDPEKRYNYFKSIIEVRDSLKQFSETIEAENEVLYNAVLEKITSLNEVIFSHLVFKDYDTKEFKRIINLLRENNLYPLQYKAEGKKMFVKFGLNYLPLAMNIILRTIRKK